MTDFIPPYPIRASGKLGSLDTLKLARQDLLSIWPEKAFDRQFLSIKLVNRSVFIANHPQIVRHVFVTHHANYNKKSSFVRKAVEPLVGDGLFVSEGEIWQKQRDALTPLFEPEQLARYGAGMVKTLEERIRQWSALTSGDNLPVLPEMKELAAEIIGKVLFGDSFSPSASSAAVHRFAEYQAAIEKMDIGTFFGLPQWIPSKSNKRINKAAREIHLLFDEIIRETEKETDSDSLLGKLLTIANDATDPGALSRERIRNELIGLFMAGQETTANTLAWAWYLISQCPDVERRLHEEVDRVLSRPETGLEDVQKLVYTRAVVEETLRLYPPMPILSREAIADDVIRDRQVPAGSMILTVPWLLHRHKQYWDKPHHFIPERFLQNESRPDPFVYIPFSIGPRACIGQYLGMLETTLCLAMLARHFRLQLPEGEQVRHECRLMLKPQGPLPMRLAPR